MTVLMAKSEARPVTLAQSEHRNEKLLSVLRFPAAPRAPKATLAVEAVEAVVVVTAFIAN